MALDENTVRKVARLARIRVDDADLPRLATELSGIMGWVEQLAAVDTSDVPPMTSVVHRPTPMRDDIVTEGGQPDKVLGNAPDSQDGYFLVPKVVE